MGSMKTYFMNVFLAVSVIFCLLLTACDSGEAPLLGDDSKQVTSVDNDSSDDSDSADAGDGIYEYSYNDSILIPSTVDDETINIAANIFIPVEKKDGEKFPAIIFINSWALEEHEYIMQARKFAKKGYIVLSYSCRGWGFSGGKIQMGGDIDWIDFNTIVGWLGENAPVDEQNIGVCGSSLGGGGSLQAIAHDERIKTAAATSPYIDQFRSMYSQETPRLVWGSLLIFSGALMGRISPWMLDLYEYTLTGTNIDSVYEMTWDQGPVNFIDEVNKRNCPVYISSNMGDYVFFSNFAVEYFNNLTVDHKFLDLNQGTHVSAEMGGILGYKNYVFDNIHLWFDHFLKGEDTGITGADRTATITLEVKLTNERIVYEKESLKHVDGDTVSYQWPPKNEKRKVFYCTPGEEENRGVLSTGKNIEEQISTIISCFLTGTTTGIPIVSPILEENGTPFTVPLWSMIPAKSMVYLTEELESPLNLRGVPSVNLRLALSGKRGQVVLYLFDVDENDNATFITHSFKTWWNAVEGEIMDVPLDFVFNAYDIEAGHRLALAIDTSDTEYGIPTIYQYKVSFVHDDVDQMVLSIPLQ